MSISTVSQPAYVIGSEAARLLLRRIAGDTSPPRRLLLDADLRIRSSSKVH
jgi:LacI family transcriptional regulator